MKILIDMNLTPLWREPLQAAGHEATHWSEVGDPSASDEILLKWSWENGFVVLTLDLDYGILLPATGAQSPSVVQVRSNDVDPAVLAPSLLRTLHLSQSEIENGALITVYMDRYRISTLPLRQ